MPGKSSSATPTSALFVRLPVEHARRLDQAAAALRARKKDVVAGLVQRHVDPHSREGLEALREMTEASRTPRRVVVDLPDEGLAVGHHSFQPAQPPAVLNARQVAELLEVSEEAVLELAER